MLYHVTSVILCSVMICYVLLYSVGICCACDICGVILCFIGLNYTMYSVIFHLFHYAALSCIMSDCIPVRYIMLYHVISYSSIYVILCSVNLPLLYFGVLYLCNMSELYHALISTECHGRTLHARRCHRWECAGPGYPRTKSLIPTKMAQKDTISKNPNCGHKIEVKKLRSKKCFQRLAAWHKSEFANTNPQDQVPTQK